MSQDVIAALLNCEEPLGEEGVIALQRALVSEGYKKNFNAWGNDGDMGRLTRRDTVDYIKANPEIITTLSQSILEDLINHHHAKDLAAIVKANPELEDDLRQTVNEVLAGRESVDDLPLFEANILQANLSMLGMYHLKVDGDVRDGTIGAYKQFCKSEPDSKPWGPQGAICGASHQEILDHLDESPELIISLTPELKEELINGGFGDELLAAVKKIPEIKDILKDQNEAILDGVSDLGQLSKAELKLFQANSYLEGAYPQHLKVDGIIGLGSTEALYKHRGYDVDDGRWKIQAQMTSEEESGIANLDIIVVSPDGEVHKFPHRSGGVDGEMMPGLKEPLPASGEIYNAVYKFDWKAMKIDDTELPKDMLGDSGRGNWLRIISDREQTDRGGASGDSLGFFGLHVDGGMRGSAGCGAADLDISNDLFALIEAIPSAQKPIYFPILPPAEPGIGRVHIAELQVEDNRTMMNI